MFCYLSFSVFKNICHMNNSTFSVAGAGVHPQVSCMETSYFIRHTHLTCLSYEFASGSAGYSGTWNSIHKPCRHVWLFQFSRGTQCVLPRFRILCTSPADQHTAHVLLFPLFILRTNSKGRRLRDRRVLLIYVLLCFVRELHLFYIFIRSAFPLWCLTRLWGKTFI
jgi:hypothetical protein